MALVTTIDIVNDINKCIKEYVVFDPNSLQSSTGYHYNLVWIQTHDVYEECPGNSISIDYVGQQASKAYNPY